MTGQYATAFEQDCYWALQSAVNHEKNRGLPTCPCCGQRSDFTRHESLWTETHGLDCGPYETGTDRWVTCEFCGEDADERDWDLANERKAA